jgi:hypothetical protein
MDRLIGCLGLQFSINERKGSEMKEETKTKEGKKEGGMKKRREGGREEGRNGRKEEEREKNERKCQETMVVEVE